MSSKRGRIILLLVCASACAGGGAPAVPSTASPAPAGTGVLSGHVTDRNTWAPLAGAEVVFSPTPVQRTTTDSSGKYTLIGLPSPPGGDAVVWAAAENYESDLRYYRAVSQDFRLYPIQRIRAGDSITVVVLPDDSLCGTDLHAPGLGGDSVCRIVRVVATDGIITVEALPTGGGARPPLVVQAIAGNRLLVARQGNPVSVRVAVGTEVVAHIEMGSGSTTPQSFQLTTSLAP